MKINAVIRNPGKVIFNTLSENKSSVQSSLIIVSGIIFGVLLYIFNSDNLTGDLFESFISYTTDFSHKSKPEIFYGLLFPDLIYLIVLTILGTSAFGTYAVASISMFASIGLGTLITYIYDSFALEGIEYCLIVLLPGKFFFILGIILLTQNCIVTSKCIKEASCNKNDRVVDFGKYTVRVMVIAVIFLLSALTDYIAIISFSSLFEFG